MFPIRAWAHPTHRRQALPEEVGPFGDSCLHLGPLPPNSLLFEGLSITNHFKRIIFPLLESQKE